MAKKAPRKSKPSKKKPAKKKAAKKKASKKPTLHGLKLKPPKDPGPKATKEQRALYQAETQLFRLRQKHHTLQEVTLAKKTGVEERKDKIENLKQAVTSVIREGSHDKPAKSLDQCRGWQLDIDKKETDLATFTKKHSERIKKLEAEFQQLLFDDQLTLPGVEGKTKDAAANTAPPNGTDVEALIKKLIGDKQRVEIKISRKKHRGTVVGPGPDNKPGTVWVELDEPTKIRGKERKEVAVKAETLRYLLG